jgi:hypothetical protein
MRRLLAVSEENTAVKRTVAEIELQYITNWKISILLSETT